MKKVKIAFITVFAVVASVVVGNTVFALSPVSIDNGETLRGQISAGAYPDMILEVGKPVQISLYIEEDDLNNCNNEIIIPAWNISQKLSVGENILTLTPNEVGEFEYTCWMGMVQGNIKVVPKGSQKSAIISKNQSSENVNNCLRQHGNKKNDKRYQSNCH